MGPLVLPLAALAADLAPPLLRWLAGPAAEEVAQDVAGVVQAVAGTADPLEVASLIAGDQGKAVELKVALARIVADREAAERKTELELALARLADTEKARNHALLLAQAGSRLAWVPAVLTAALVLGFFFTLWALLSKGGSVTSEMRDTMLVLIGAQAAAFQSAVQYWIGTSRGAVEMRQGMQGQTGQK